MPNIVDYIYCEQYKKFYNTLVLLWKLYQENVNYHILKLWSSFRLAQYYKAMKLDIKQPHFDTQHPSISRQMMSLWDSHRI